MARLHHTNPRHLKATLLERNQPVTGQQSTVDVVPHDSRKLQHRAFTTSTADGDRLATVEVWVDRQTGRLVIEIDGHRDGVVIDVDYNGETAAVLENGVNTW